jgi:hypothetical protein
MAGRGRGGPPGNPFGLERVPLFRPEYVATSPTYSLALHEDPTVGVSAAFVQNIRAMRAIRTQATVLRPPPIMLPPGEPYPLLGPLRAGPADIGPANGTLALQTVWDHGPPRSIWVTLPAEDMSRSDDSALSAGSLSTGPPSAGSLSTDALSAPEGLSASEPRGPSSPAEQRWHPIPKRRLSRSADSIPARASVTLAPASVTHTAAHAQSPAPHITLKDFLPYDIESGKRVAPHALEIPVAVAHGYNSALSMAFGRTAFGDPFAISLVYLDEVLGMLDAEQLSHLGRLLTEAARVCALPILPALTRFHLVALCVAEHLAERQRCV